MAAGQQRRGSSVSHGPQRLGAGASNLISIERLLKMACGMAYRPRLYTVDTPHHKVSWRGVSSICSTRTARASRTETRSTAIPQALRAPGSAAGKENGGRDIVLKHPPADSIRRSCEGVVRRDIFSETIADDARGRGGPLGREPEATKTTPSSLLRARRRTGHRARKIRFIIRRNFHRRRVDVLG